ARPASPVIIAGRLWECRNCGDTSPRNGNQLVSGRCPARSCAVANRTICSCIVLSLKYATLSVSARRFTRFHPTAAATTGHGHHTADRPPPSAGGRTASRVIADARSGRAPAILTRSPGPRVAGAAGVTREVAGLEVPGADACVARGDARVGDLRAVRAHENLHRWLARYTRLRRTGDRAADGCRTGPHINHDPLVEPHCGELLVCLGDRLGSRLTERHQYRAIADLRNGSGGGRRRARGWGRGEGGGRADGRPPG